MNGGSSELVHAEGENQTKLNDGQLPHLLITEVIPDSTNVNSVDGYEFVEVYNNTDKEINFKDYNIHYRYPDGPDYDQIWGAIPEDVWINSGETMVFWVMNGGNSDQTVSDFNANYNTNLVENENIVKLDGNSISNSRKRSMVIATNTGHEIVLATYNDGVDDTQPDKGIFYKYPEDGSNVMIQTSAGTEPATPGALEANQVPETLISVGDDTISPTIDNLTGKTEVTPTENIEIIAGSQDDSLVKTFTLFYKNNNQSDFKSVNLAINREDSLYHHSINFLDVIGSEKIEYYFVASDGINETASDTYEIDIVEGSVDPRLNISDGDLLTGETIIKGNINGVDPDDIVLSIDGEEITETYGSLEQEAYFVFEGEGLNNGAQNAVTIEGEILQIVEGITGYSSVIVPVDPEKFQLGSNNMAIRAGDTEGPFFEDTFPIDRYVDDFDVRNVRLILADGTAIRDSVYSDPTEEIHIGDETYRAAYFDFDLPAEKLTSATYNLDTSTLSDGEHLITVSAPGHGEATASVLVDNNGPVIETTIEEGKQYKGEFTIDVTTETEGTEVESLDVTLDGTPIEIPYETSSVDLAAGDHVLQVTAIDKAGNKSEKAITFTIMEEMPNKPEVNTPEDGAIGVTANPELSVNVTDPTNDELDVTFYQGRKYNVENKENVAAFRNAVGTEPPQDKVPEGETALNEEEYTKLMSSDDDYIITDSTEKFPYLRFEVEVGEDLDDKDIVELIWEGKSLEGRKVTMYAWNYNEAEEGEWVAIDSSISETEEDFVLTANVSVEDFVRDNKVDVLIQDQIPPPENYDYTFAWMSDTQFYTEIWPDIYESQVNWIKDNQESLNIDYVFHTGDIVNEVNEMYQWDRADQFMGVLDSAAVPYGVLAGNHDVDLENDNDYTIYSQYFGANRFQDKSYYGESYKDNRGHYDLISSSGNDYIMVYMGWGIGDEDIAWINDVLAEHPNRKAILNFHTYLTPDGTRSAIGERLYQEIVIPNENVVMVLSGHLTDSELLTDEIDDDGDGTPDRNVYQMLSNYQGNPDGGAGYMKLMHFDTSSEKVYVNTYSPYLDDYNYYDPEEFPGKDEFTIDLNLEPEVKRVATDYFEVNVYTDDEIGTVENVSSGQNAEMEWNGLEENQTYYWYVTARDNFGGKSMSDIQRFTTGDVIPAPENLRVTGKMDTTVNLAWDAVIEGDKQISYDIYQNGEQIASTAHTAYEIVGLNPGTDYQFTVTAKDESGKKSEVSNQITVTTLMNLSEIQNLVNGYIDSDDLRGPLANQLLNKMKQAEKFFNKGSVEKATKHMQDFLKHLNNESMQRHISPDAKEVLNQEVNKLVESWLSK
ncbi:FIMAH domain-containing protein [Virgibacillus indicus]|uniref:FIMAH domain-containing protein n=1 Tax=Virgibacillus indicus TaxID=2024554 RepID=UPI0013FD14E2|nr:metallophosphoesterase [Virgibacillus indicus]